jgi:hypothetical protein
LHFFKKSLKEKLVTRPINGFRDITKEGVNMDVHLNHILRTAERMISDRKNSSREKSTGTSNEVSPLRDVLDFSNQVQTKYSSLQIQMKEYQASISKEQARLGILEEKEFTKDELEKFLYNDEPLFDSLPDTLDQGTLISITRANLATLIQKIREKEVESENILSLKNHSKKDDDIESEDLENLNLKPIREQIVQKLISN